MEKQMKFFQTITSLGFCVLLFFSVKSFKEALPDHIYVNIGDEIDYDFQVPVTVEIQEGIKEALAKAKNNYSVNQQIENLNDDYITIYNEALEDAEEGLENVRETRDEAKDAYNEARAAVDSTKAALDAASKNYNPDNNNYQALKTAYEKAAADLETAEQTGVPAKDSEEYKTLEEAIKAIAENDKDLQTAEGATH